MIFKEETIDILNVGYDMELFSICIITIIVNFFLEIGVNISIYKLFADLGYIFKNKRLKEIIDEEIKEENILSQLIYDITPLIPFYNLYITIIKELECCSCAEDNIDLFKDNFIIEKMTTEELEQYSKNKTGLNAIKLERNMHKKRKNNHPIIYSDGSSIWYNYDEDKLEESINLLDSIVIVEARGSVEKYSKDELIKMVYDSHIAMAEVVLNSYDESEDFINDYTKDGNIELSIDDFMNGEELLIEKNTNKYKGRSRVKRR